MKDYKDIISGDVLCSDAYQQLSAFQDSDFDDVAFEIQGSFTNSEEKKTNSIDIVEKFNLCEVSFSRNEYIQYLNGFVPRVKEYLDKEKPDRAEQFMKDVGPFVRKIVSMLDELKYYYGKSMNADANVILSYYKEGGDAPLFVYFKDGLKK